MRGLGIDLMKKTSNVFGYAAFGLLCMATTSVAWAQAGPPPENSAPSGEWRPFGGGAPPQPASGDPRYQDPRYQDSRQDPRYQDPRYQDPGYADSRYGDSNVEVEDLDPPYQGQAPPVSGN